MLSAGESRRRLADAADAVWAGDVPGMDAAARWLSETTARELVLVDGVARSWTQGRSTLGDARQWWDEAMAQPSPLVAALASMHPDGYLRERAVTVLANQQGPIADRFLALRLTDHVPVIRAAAAHATLVRIEEESATRIMPVLELMQDRQRISDMRALFLLELTERHGEARVWQLLRASPDRILRRAAFRHSIDAGLVGVDDAQEAFEREDDQIVRSLLCHLIADHGTSDVIRDVLLLSRSAEGRALALVRLDAAQIDPDALEALLTDTSVLVRFWARRRLTEAGGDPAAACAALARRTDVPPARRARAYAGLGEAGVAVDRQEVLGLMRSAEPALARVGLRLLARSAQPEDVPELWSVLRSGSAGQARLATDGLVLVRRAWQVSDLRTLKSDPDRELRRRGYQLHRRLGAWEETIADLEALDDPDSVLAASGRRVRSPAYAQPDTGQRRRLRELLMTAPLSRTHLLDLAVAAGVRDVVADRFPATTPAPPQPGFIRRMLGR